MKLNFNEKILGIDGKPLKEGKPGEEKTIQLKDIVINVLMTSFQDEQSLEAGEKVRRYRLALLIEKGGTQDISVEDVSEIKRLIGKAYPPLIVGRSYDIIDGKK